MLRIGWNSNSFTGHHLLDVLPILADHGYQAVAITPDVGCLDPRFTSPKEVRSVGALCEQLGLKPVIETGARFSLDPLRKHRPNLLETDASKDLRLKYLRTFCEWCELLGADVLSFWSGVLPSDQTEEGAESRLQEAFDNLAPLAERYGARLALEPEPGHFVATLSDWKRVTQRSEGAVGLSLDVGHLLVNDEHSPVQALEDFQKDILNIQLDDMPKGKHSHVPPGEGDMDWPALREALRSFGAKREAPACWELPRDGHRFHELVIELREFL